MKRKIKRTIQRVTGLHRIHHINWSYGYKLPFVRVGYFKKFGFKKMKGTITDQGNRFTWDYHDCTLTGIY